MRGRKSLAPDSGVGQVGDRFRRRGEDRGAVLPSHREDEWERDQLFLTRPGREGNSKSGDVIHVEVDPIEAVADIHFKHVDRAISRIRQEDLAQDAVQGMSELHGFQGRQREGLVIDIPPAVVTYPPRAAIALGNNSRGRDTEAGEVLRHRCREDDPLSLGDHVNKFLSGEVEVLEA